MKQLNLITFLCLFIPFTFISCSSEKKNELILIDITHLYGSWMELDGDTNQSFENEIIYFFNRDNSCVIYTYEHADNKVTPVLTHGSFRLNSDKDMITVYLSTNDVKEFYINELNDKKMKWTRTTTYGPILSTERKVVNFMKAPDNLVGIL